MSTPTLEELVHQAVDGDDASLEALVTRIQDDVYGLALRMMGSEADARDCTQDILIRIVTRLSSYRGDSKFTTWVYRVSANYLIDTKRRARETVSFEQLEAVLSKPGAPLSHRPDRAALIDETFLGCTLAMLRCLDREHRLAFIFGAILELDGSDAAAALGTTPSAYRKRLSRARHRLQSFMRAHCGVANEAAPCRCDRQAQRNIDRGWLDPSRLPLRCGTGDLDEAREHIRALGQVVDAVELFRRHPSYRAPAEIAAGIGALVRARVG